MANPLPPLDFVIDEDGHVTIEVNGCEGSVCENVTDALLQKLGTIEDVQRKPEYYIENGRPDYIDSGTGEE